MIMVRRYKLKFYEYAKSYCREHNCCLIEPRFFSLYGPGDFSGTLIMSTLNKMMKNENKYIIKAKKEEKEMISGYDNIRNYCDCNFSYKFLYCRNNHVKK